MSESNPSSSKIITAVVAYSLCSSSLLLLNKLVLSYFPFPSYITSFQFAFAVIVIQCMQIGWKLKVKGINSDVINSYGIYVILFMCGIYANMRALETSNVETVIVARACTPLIVAVLEYNFLGRQAPSLKSTFSMLTIVLGAWFYVMNDGKFSSEGASSYNWAILYMILISMEMTFGKHVKNKVETTLWESVYYTNILSVLPMFGWAAMMGEHNKYMQPETNATHGVILLIISSIVGVGIGYSSWSARGLVSATSFTLVGVVNKFLTILVNFMIWDNHANVKGIVGLMVCLCGATFYRQAPAVSGGKDKGYKPTISEMISSSTGNTATQSTSPDHSV